MTIRRFETAGPCAPPSTTKRARHTVAQRLILGFSVLLCSGPSTALTQSSLGSTEARREPRDLSLTVSGGVSLGAYQAGYLYLSSQAIKHAGHRLRLLTGASAGSANTLLTALDACREPNPSPSTDLGYRTWLNLGYRELFSPGSVGTDHIFSRQAFESSLAHLASVWAQGLPESCDVVWGVTVTRASARSVRLREGLAVPRLAAKFAVRIRGRGHGRPPQVTNYHDPHSNIAEPILPLRAGTDEAVGAHNFRMLSHLVFASSAFPVAFAPQRLGYCLRGGHAPHDNTCEAAEEEALFIDGGVFDNTPLRFAMQLARLGLERSTGGQMTWRDLDAAADADRAPRAEADPPRDLVYSYVDPDTTSYPSLPAAPPREDHGGAESDVLALLGRLLGEFVGAARANELYLAAEEAPDAVERVFLTRRHFPTVSGLLGAFLGFFEREFRRFDFYLGMFDAYANAEVMMESAGGPDVRAAMLEALHPSFGELNPERLPADWRPFACMLGWYLPQAHRWRPACAGPELEDFRILVQVSLDRLYAHCAQLADDPALRGHCGAAARGGAVPRVIAPLRSGRSDRVHAGESDFEHTMRLLAGYRFHFRDLGLERREARYGSIKIRRKILGMIDALAAAQPGAVGTLLLTAGRLVVNDIAYEPPRHWLYAVVGTNLEIGVNLLPWEWHRSWLRLHVALRVDGLRTLVEPQDRAVMMALFGGVEFQLLFATSPVLQPTIGIRGGHSFAFNDRFHRRACTAERARFDSRGCSQWVTGVYVATAVLERLRVQLAFDYFPEPSTFDGRRFALEFGVGLQLF